jgi:POT family proton-dependent oligopeptide transporter
MTEKQKAASEEHKDQVVELTPEQTRERMVALILVFFVVIFFWMSFHQNGAAMTIFARDYTVSSVDNITNLAFDLFGLLPIFLSVLGIYFLVRKKSTLKVRIAGAISMVVFAALACLRFNSYSDSNPFTPEKFQHFNPFFIVVLTPIVVGFFGWLAGRGKEPSAPKKIGIGMVITAIGFLILVVGSSRLVGYSPGELGEIRAPAEALLSPHWLIGTYFTLTIAELFLSPMGISFVSKVSPPKYKGLMQGGWLAATAVGNYAVGLVGLLWNKVPLWAFWGVLVVCCVLSALFIFSILKKLEKATS